MSVEIRCRCGYQGNARLFIPIGRIAREVKNGKRTLVLHDAEIPANHWECPQCKVRWCVTKEGIKFPRRLDETPEQLRARIRKAWGLAEECAQA